MERKLNIDKIAVKRSGTAVIISFPKEQREDSIELINLWMDELFEEAAQQKVSQALKEKIKKGELVELRGVGIKVRLEEGKFKLIAIKSEAITTRFVNFIEWAKGQYGGVIFRNKK